MKKKLLTQRLSLKKETIANLSYEEMRKSFGGAEPTKQGNTCKTDDACCILPLPRRIQFAAVALNGTNKDCQI